jgi:hypothetical protein
MVEARWSGSLLPGHKLAPVGSRSRATGDARVKLFGRATPVAPERDPTVSKTVYRPAPRRDPDHAVPVEKADQRDCCDEVMR